MFSRKTMNMVCVLGGLVLTALPAKAEKFVRWTTSESQSTDLEEIVAEIVQKTGYSLKASDFLLDEDRPLAFNHYRRYSQVAAGVRVKSMTIRLWSVETKFGATLVQLEAQVEDPTKISTPATMKFLRNTIAAARTSTAGDREVTSTSALESALPRDQADSIVREALKNADDKTVIGLTHHDWWFQGDLVREVVAHTKHGKHIFLISHATQKVVDHRFEGHPNSDAVEPGSFSLPAQVYPVYEEYGGKKLDRVPVMLTGLRMEAPRPDVDPFSELRTRTYLDSKQDPTRALTEQGRAEGYWSEPWLRDQIALIAKAVPLMENTVTSQNGALLVGDYATVSIHPDAFEKLTGVTLEKLLAPYIVEIWSEVSGSEDYQMTPKTAYFGKPLLSANDAWNRPATRDPQHNPSVYMNEGFDEVQVYYAINRLFEALRPKGFIDADLATRPFHAFLYDPDVEGKDNAYYANDTINFATYSPNELNMARDNTTIWHELGHGVMDRLMGDYLHLADTGGLSEGMADFVAEMVLRDAVGSQTFPGSGEQRIINKTGFYLTNESHDDGEAYGGAMKDVLDAAIKAWGTDGLAKMTDLTLEAMRLTRDHPHLTAQDWFDHMLFADSIGRAGVRAPGELTNIIKSSFQARNFVADPSLQSTLLVKFDDKPVEAGQAGSRSAPINAGIWGEGATKTFTIKVKYHAAATFLPQPPFKLKVALTGGPLQGALHWQGEENSPLEYVVDTNDKEVEIPLTITGVCDAINRADGGCSDFAYVQIWPIDGEKPVAKKRFYLRLTPPETK